MVFDGRMLRKIFGRKREEVRAGFRNQHTEALHDLYSSPSSTRVVKSRTEVGGACGMCGEERCIQCFGGGNLKEGDNWKTWMYTGV